MLIRPAEVGDAETMSTVAKRPYGGYVEPIGVRPHPMDDDYAAKIRDGRTFVAEEGEVVGLLVRL